MNAWQRRGHFLGVSVNVHASTLVDLSFPEQVAVIVDAAGIARHLVTLEVTEEGAISDPKRSLVVLNELRRLGFTLVVDDYGTGMAALSYLKDLPVQGLKLDRSFIVQLDQPRTRAIVTSTVALADNLEMQLVAEGVEDVETAEVLRTLGAVSLRATCSRGRFLVTASWRGSIPTRPSAAHRRYRRRGQWIGWLFRRRSVCDRHRRAPMNMFFRAS
jgi:diguanylate cyclase